MEYIIKTLPIFLGIQTMILNLSPNPIIAEALSVNIICGLTASASGGLGITLNALAPTFLQMSEPLRNYTRNSTSYCVFIHLAD